MIHWKPLHSGDKVLSKGLVSTEDEKKKGEMEKIGTCYREGFPACFITLQQGCILQDTPFMVNLRKALIGIGSRIGNRALVGLDRPAHGLGFAHSIRLRGSGFCRINPPT